MNSFRTVFKHIVFFSTFLSIPVFANHPYAVGLDGGVAIPTQLGNTASFPLGFSTFTYSPNHNEEEAFIAGISFNRIVPITSLYTSQIGVSFHHLTSMTVKGNLQQGISQPLYQANYYYRIHSYQYLVDAKLSRSFCNVYFPYVYLGLGLASNRAYNYSTTVPSYLTLTPEFSNQTTTAFSYSVGLGVDYFVRSQLSIGIGYRFINLGKIGPGSGAIRTTSVGAKLTQSNLYLNSVMAQLTYFM